MPNRIDAAGITIETYDEIVNGIVVGTPDVPGLEQIYGSDINVDQNSPDGQLVRLLALSKQDVLDLIVEDYDSKDPDQAVGVALDAVSQLCGITRKGGTYTEVSVNVTVDRATNLNGLNLSAAPYTVADAEGNQFYLKNSASLTVGVNSLLFRAARIGQILVQPNTITVPVTIVAGVTSLNNPSAASQTGQNQETDSQFRIRRQKSVATPSQGYFASMYGGLSDLPDVASVLIIENNSNVEDANGIPAHSIWVIVDGGTAEDIANVIYRTRNAGCGMFGDETYDVTQIDGSPFPIRFDFGGTQNLYVRMHLDAINGATIDQDGLAAFLAANYIFQLNQPADISTLTGLVLQFNPNLVVSQAAVSADDITWTTIAYPLSKKDKFILTADNIAFL